jgi:DNA-directed RNA polymerase subunit RPC12/RpoP
MNVEKDNLVIVCPACGYSFKKFDKNEFTNKIKCPMCGYEFSKPKIQPNKEDFFQKRI